MRVCMIFEGCYPYVFGGVSSWAHQYLQAMPEIEFVLWCIGAKSEDRGKFKFELPPNVAEVKEVFLDDAFKLKHVKSDKLQFTGGQLEAMEKLFVGETPNWDVLFDMFQNKKMNPVSLLFSREFLNVLVSTCKEKTPYIAFGDYFHTVRSMLLPELYLLTQEVPEADIYHSVATGYGGLLGSMGKWKNKKPLIITEHGIYTREREEELLRARWVSPHFRKNWIDLFYCFSDCAYSHADKVTALFQRANDVQAELGCPREKLSVIENGIHYERFCHIPAKQKDGWVDIGAVVRIAKIKDIKTMIYAFAEVKKEVPKSRLHIMGDVDDEEYFEECKKLIAQLKVEDILFTGVVKVTEYMEKIDFVILTSISEGQPLSVLEAFASERACVTTDVGCCRELIQGDDEFGEAGFCVPPMYKEGLVNAMIQLCRNENMRNEMAKAGKKRVEKYYRHETSMEKYKMIYREVL